MSEESRTKKTLRNTVAAFAYKSVDVVLAFLLRTLFIQALGISYLGLNSLFTNVLTVLSLMELGVGSAIVFSLYKPLAEHDEQKIAALMLLYKRVYNALGIFICIAGASLTPFLQYIIQLPDNIPYLYAIYWLTIANTSVTYFLSYRRSLLIADQRSDINTKNLILYRFIRFGVLTCVLAFTRNYIIYLATDVLTTVASNIHITYIIKKRYEYLAKVEPEPITKEERGNILKYMMSGVFSKIGQTIVTSTDNILISAFISTLLVGYYANYSMVTNNFEVMVYLFFNGVTASVGNFAIQKNGAEAEKLFKKVHFVNYVIAYTLTVCLWSLLSPFVQLWVGRDYLLPDFTVAVIILNFYIAIFQKGIENFMGAVGEMFYINRYRSLIEGIVNLAVSIFLVRYTSLGITGVFLGTTACYLCGRVWMDAYTLYNNWFKVPYREYLSKYFRYSIVVFGTALLGKKLTNIVWETMGITVISWLLSGTILVIICIILLAVLWGKTVEFKYFIHLFRKKLGTE